MANKFKLKQSAVAGKVPATTDLELGELAINTNDGKLFLKKKVGATETIVDVTASAGGVSSVAGRTGDVTLAVADVSGAAPLASPALTGTPTAPTAAVNTSNTQLATTAFVNAEIANDAAPIAHVGSTGAAHGAATTTVAGFMSAADKSKLDGIASGATANTGTVTGVTATAPVVSSGGTAPVISMAAATATVNGYMTSTYAAKLDGIAAGAQVNTVTSVAGKTGAVSVTSSDVGLGNVENKSSATIRSEITSANVTGALGYTPVARAGANRPGGYRLQRRDDDSDYSVQTYWTGARWRLYGYVGDAAHADTHVGYADAAGWGGDCPGLGSGQSWQAVSRAQSTNYTNTTGRAIELVVAYVATAVGQRCVFVVGGVTITPQNGQGSSSTYGGARITIPNGATYQWYTSGGSASSISTWELR